MYIQAYFPDGFWASIGAMRNNHDFPPSPGRLFSSLVHGHYLRQKNGFDDNDTKVALEWLEQQPLPDIYASEVIFNKSPRVYVPRNEYEIKKDNIGNKFLSTPKVDRRFMAAYPINKSVFYNWENLDAPNWSGIEQILPYVPYLGTGRSFVRLTMGRNLSEDVIDLPYQYKLDPLGEKAFSSYYPGRLAYLDECYQACVKPDYRQVSYRRVVKAKFKEPFCMWEKFIIFRIVGRYRPQVRHSAYVSDAVRKYLLKICGDEGIRPEAIIAKELKPHCSYIPLSWVGRTGNGQIYGVGIAIPKASKEEVDQCELAISKLNGFHFNFDDFVLVKAGSDIPRTLQPETWTGPAHGWTTWATVTPVEGCPPEGETMEEKRNHIANYIAVNCQHLGLPHPEDIQIGYLPHFDNSEQAKAFVSRNSWPRDDGTQYRAGFKVHVKIKFSSPVKGPVVIGRGRNFGLGIFRPVNV